MEAILQDAPKGSNGQLRSPDDPVRPAPPRPLSGDRDEIGPDNAHSASGPRGNCSGMSRARSFTVAKCLSAEGCVRLPPRWVKQEDLEMILAISEIYSEEVNQVRTEVREARQGATDEVPAKMPASDPRTDLDAAWAAYEKLRG